VRLNKRTETAIDRDDSEIGHFLCRSSSKKDMDITTYCVLEKSSVAVFIEWRWSDPLCEPCGALAALIVYL
jgi:hypothetical protein